MKICILTTSYPLWEGHAAGCFIHASAAELVHLGHDVTVVAPGHKAALPRETLDGVKIHRFQYMPIRSHQTLAYGEGIIPNIRSNRVRLCQAPSFMAAFTAAAITYTRRCNIIHAHWGISAYPAIICRAINQKPFVISLRGSDLSGAGGGVVTRLSYKASQAADGLIAVSEPLRKQLPANKRESSTVILNGVDLNGFKANHDKSILRSLGIAENAKVLLFVGRLTNVKGPDIALEAFSLLDKSENIHLLYVGGGELREKLESAVEASSHLRGRVTFTGEIASDQMHRYYAAADLLVITSRHEGLPNSLLEAMASALPIVSVPVGGVGQLIGNDDLGYITSANSVACVTEKLTNVLSDMDAAKDTGKRARKWIEQNLSWNKHALQLVDFYNKIISQSKDEDTHNIL